MSDDFSARYRLLKCVLVEDGIRTHNAQELASGRVVMVHITDAAGPDEVDALRSQLASLPPADKNKVLEAVTLASGFAVVTEYLQAPLTFRGWLREHASVNAAPTPGAASGASNSAKISRVQEAIATGENALPGSFTQLFANLSLVPDPGAAESVSVVDARAANVPVVPLVQPEILPPEPVLQTPSLPASATPAPGSFTMLFGRPDLSALSVPPTMPGATPPATGTGSVRGVPSQAPHQNSAELAVPPAASLAAPPPAPPAALTPAGGEFTRMFAPIKADQRNAAAPPPASRTPTGPALSSSPSPVAPWPAASLPTMAPAASLPPAAAPVAGPPPAPAQAATHAPGLPSASSTEAPPLSNLMPPQSGAIPFSPAPLPESPKTATPNTAWPNAAAPSASTPSAPRPAAAMPVAGKPFAATPRHGVPSPLLAQTSSTPPAVPAAALPLASLPLAPPARPPALPHGATPAVPAALQPATAFPPPPPPASSPLTAASSFGYEDAPPAQPPPRKPPGEFTMMFGAPATAAPLPDSVRPSPMREAPPPTFSPLTPEHRLESPPVEPLHRVMSSNPNYGGGIHQDGPSPIAPNVVGGGQFFGLPPLAPRAPEPLYPPAHASPLFAQERQPQAGGPGQAPGILPPPIFSGGSSTPLSALGGARPLVNASAGPSEFTQLISSASAPVIPALAPTAIAGQGSRSASTKRRLPTGLIIVINAVLFIAVMLVFFVWRRPIPTKSQLIPAKPVMPNIPTAPKIPTGR